MKGQEFKNNQLQIKRKVSVTQYAPETFRKIREEDGVSDDQLWRSLKAAENIKGIQSCGTGAGLSG